MEYISSSGFCLVGSGDRFNKQSRVPKGNVQGSPAPLSEFRDSSTGPYLLEFPLPDGADLADANATHRQKRPHEFHEVFCVCSEK